MAGDGGGGPLLVALHADRVVSMEIASLTRRPRVRVTDVIGSEPIAWNSLSVKLPAGA